MQITKHLCRKDTDVLSTKKFNSAPSRSNPVPSAVALLLDIIELETDTINSELNNKSQQT